MSNSLKSLTIWHLMQKEKKIKKSLIPEILDEEINKEIHIYLNENLFNFHNSK